MPPPLWFVPSPQMPLVDVVNVINRSHQQRHKGVWGVVVHAMEEEEVHGVVLRGQVPIQPGLDDGRMSSGVTLVGLRGRQYQAGEGGGGGAAP